MASVCLCPIHTSSGGYSKHISRLALPCLRSTSLSLAIKLVLWTEINKSRCWLDFFVDFLGASAKSGLAAACLLARELIASRLGLVYLACQARRIKRAIIQGRLGSTRRRVQHILDLGVAFDLGFSLASIQMG